MREVKVRRTDLLTKVQDNRQKHLADYRDAVIGYRQKAVEALNAAIAGFKKQVDAVINSGTEAMPIEPVHFDLMVPQNHVKDYDQVIAMLAMSIDENLTIRSDEFAMYVMDDWSWKGQFELSKTLYTGARSR